jgi:hypothetical protein
MDVLRLLS